MTLDVQPDRSASPLATVSDAISPPRPAHPDDDASGPEPGTPTVESDSFAGFGSFS